MTEKASLLISGESWIGSSDVSIIGNHESVISHVFNVICDDWTLVLFGHWRELLGFQMLFVVLLGKQSSGHLGNFFTDDLALSIGS